MPNYINRNGFSVPNQIDYDRILAILEMDSFPEGF